MGAIRTTITPVLGVLNGPNSPTFRTEKRKAKDAVWCSGELVSASSTMRWGHGIFFGIFVLGGIILGITMMVNTVQYAQTRSWVKTKGTVTNLRLEERAGRRGSKSYLCHVRYSYLVDGVKHVGDRANIHRQSGDRALCKKLGTVRPPNTIRVFYNKKHPSTSSLNIEFNPYFLSLLVTISVLFLSIGCCGLADMFQNGVNFDVAHSKLALGVCAVYAIVCGVWMFGVSADAIARGQSSGFFSGVVGLVLVGAGFVGGAYIRDF